MTATSLCQIIRHLNEAKVRYLVIGGLAVAAHGYLRCTIDLDLLLRMEEANIARASGCLQTLGFAAKSEMSLADFADPVCRRRLVEKRTMILRLKSPLHDKTGIDLLTCDILGFDDVYPRRMDLVLSDGILLPVCGYEDLLTLKRLANRRIDLVDIEQLEKARRQPTPTQLADPWFVSTFEGAELSQLRESAVLPFAAKVAALEEMHTLGRMLQESRRKIGGARTIRPSGLIEDI